VRDQNRRLIGTVRNIARNQSGGEEIASTVIGVYVLAADEDLTRGKCLKLNVVASRATLVDLADPVFVERGRSCRCQAYNTNQRESG
jgi:hypothetical protein